MDILYVTLSSSQANNSAMIRNHALIEGFSSNGHNVDLLVLNGLDEKNNFDWHENVNVIRIDGNTLYSKYRSKSSSLKKVIRKAFFKISIFDNTISHVLNFNENIIKEKLKEEYDLIISSSDPKTAHLYAKKLIEFGIKYEKWIQYWGDPLALDITNNSIYPKSLLSKYERKVLRNADGIVYVSPFTYKSQVDLFPNLKNKMSFIPIPYSKEDYQPLSHTNGLIKIGYFGDYFSKYRDINPLLNAIENQEKYHLEIAGASDLELMQKENILINERLDLNTLKNKEIETDIFVCILNKSGSQIPGKIYKYASTNKPIMILLDGDNMLEMREYLASFHRFIICENNTNDIKATLSEITISDLKKYNPLKKISAQKIAGKLIDFSNRV